MSKSFISYPLKHDLIADLREDEFPTLLYGWNDGELNLFPGTTYYGYVHKGQMILHHKASHSLFVMREGMYFSLPGSGSLLGEGQGIVIARLGYQGVFSVGGPIEEEGRLLYIDGCRDSLLIPPVVMGEPCLNALYFPSGINQTQHTHPSMRVGMVVSGCGQCVTPDEVIPLTSGQVFVIPAQGVHSFRTEDSPMIVVAWHPDSDFGPNDRNHPMINRTWIDGISASHLEEIRTHA